MNITLAENYYFIEHYDNSIHVTAYFDKSYTLDKLYIPEKVWGTDYSKQIKNIKIIKGKYNKHNDQYLFDNSLPIKIEYDLINICKDDYLNQFFNRFNHYIDKKRFLFIGMGAFIYPLSIANDTEVTIRVISRLNVSSNVTPYVYNASFIKTDFKKLQDIVLLGGTKFVDPNEIGVNLLTFYIRDNFYKRVIKAFKQSSKKFNSFWKNHNFSLENKIVIIISPPDSVDENAYTANVRHNTMLAFLNPEKIEDIDLSNLFDHELHHFIFGCNALYGPKWFTEGFSDYYKDKISALKEGVIQSFIDKYNNILYSYYKSPYSHLTDIQIDKLFFENKKVERLPYYKGYLIAGQIDTLVSLDQVINLAISRCKTYGNCQIDLITLIKNIDNLEEDNKTKLEKLIKKFETLKSNEFIPFKPHTN